jgi:DNA-binding MarR family transcriptional regulator
LFESDFSDAQHLSFAFLHLSECKKFEHYIKDKVLNYRDVTVLASIMIRCDLKTARVKFMVKKLAEDIGMNATSVSASIAKLKKLMLVAMFIEEDGEKYYMINPYIFSAGKKQKWGFCVQKFFSAFE